MYDPNHGLCFSGGRALDLESALYLGQVAISLLPKREWHILVFDHVLHAILQGQKQQEQEIHKQYGPKDREVKHSEERQRERAYDGTKCAVPELKFWKLTRERPELAIVRRWKNWAIFSFWINSRRQEVNEQVQQINPKTVRHNVETLLYVDPDAVDKEQGAEDRPA